MGNPGGRDSSLRRLCYWDKCIELTSKPGVTVVCPRGRRDFILSTILSVKINTEMIKDY